MTENKEPSDKNYEISRQLRSINRRVDIFKSEFKEFRNEINQKLDTILKHITGIN